MFETIELGPRQRMTVATAMTLGAVLVLVLVFSVIVWGLALFVGTFQNVLLPPVVAGVLAMLLRPYFDWLLRVCRGYGTPALVIFFLSAIVPLGIVSWFAGAFIINQLLRFFDDLPSLIRSVQDAGRTHWPQVSEFLNKYGMMPGLDSLLENPGEMVTRVLRASGAKLSHSVVSMFQSVAGLFAWAVLPVYLAFFLLAKPFEARQISEFLPFLKKKTRDDVIYLFDQFISILLTFFRGQVIIALAQGLLFALGFSLIGLPYGIIIGFMLGVLNIIPYLGSIAGLTVALPLAWFGFDGGVVRVILVLVVFAVVQAIEGFLLTPKIMGDRTGLHPALVIFAVFFWGVALGGILGMMLAIPLTAFAVVFWRLLKKKYIAEIV